MSSQSPATARPYGPRRSFFGLVWALAPVLAILLLLVWWQQGDASPIVPVDARPDIIYAQRVSPVPLPAPGAVPDGWRVTSSKVDAPAGEEKRSPVTLTIGYVTGQERFAQVVTADRPARTVVREVAPAATADGSVAVGPARWDAYRSQRGERVLVSTLGKAAVVVTGDAPDADLVLLASSVELP